MSTEYTLARVGDLPEGDHKVFRVAGREIGLFNIRGQYHALPNHCFHQNGPLCAGSVSGTTSATAESDWKCIWGREGEIIICPWHAFEFDILTGRCLADPRRRIPTYDVKVVDTEIRISLP